LIGGAYEHGPIKMPKFYGFGNCCECGIACTAGNFLISEGKKFCTACWVAKSNPEHPDLEEIREKVETAVSVWKCAKWSREEGPLPLGPRAVKK
tara:strand:+ start:278 stop:559 length:282 start_codon:yes stop_codon:yes gene_type:complete